MRTAQRKGFIMNKIKRPKSTFDREMKNPKFRNLFEQEYRELVLSELIVAMMAEDKISVRKLAKEIGIAPSVLQSVRSGQHYNLTLKNFLKLITALGGEVRIKRHNRYIPVTLVA